MTALPLRDFTDAERKRLEAIEAAPAAEESLRERVARALWDAECTQPYPWDDGDDLQRADYYRLANAALAVLSGPSSDAERAVERVVEQCRADVAYYGESDDPMAIGRVIGVREVLHAAGLDPDQC